MRLPNFSQYFRGGGGVVYQKDTNVLNDIRRAPNSCRYANDTPDQVKNMIWGSWSGPEWFLRNQTDL